MRRFALLTLILTLGLTIASKETHPSDGACVSLLGTIMHEWGNGIGVDSSGNIYITGGTYGDLGGESNAGSADIFVAKYDANCNNKMVKLLGGLSYENAVMLALDSKESICIAAYTKGDVDGQINVGSDDIVVAKYDTDGKKECVELLGTTSQEQGLGIAVDSSDNIYITGFTYGNLDGKTNKGGQDIFIAKYDAECNKKCVELLGTASNDYGYRIAVDSDDNIYITGFTYGNLDGKTNKGGRDIFIAKYDAECNKKCVELLGTTSDDWGVDITVDSSDNIYITGGTDGNLGGQTNAGGYDIVAAKYDTGCNERWVRLLGTASDDWGNGIAVDSNRNSYITGVTYGELGGENNEGGIDIVAAKYDTKGNEKWVKLLGTPVNERGYAIAVDSNGNSYITGETYGDLGDNTNEGERDIFLWKLVPFKAMPWMPLLLLGD
jgi:hypothetical protein